jgi:hypothetical protein
MNKSLTVAALAVIIFSLELIERIFRIDIITIDSQILFLLP